MQLRTVTWFDLKKLCFVRKQFSLLCPFHFQGEKEYPVTTILPSANDTTHYPPIFSVASVNPDASSSHENPDSSSNYERSQRGLLVDRISRVLFPTLFALFNCVYWYCVYDLYATRLK